MADTIDRNKIIKALQKLADGGTIKTTVSTYNVENGAKEKIKETVTKKQVWPDRSALNKLLELSGETPMDDDSEDIV